MKYSLRLQFEELTNNPDVMESITLGTITCNIENETLNSILKQYGLISEELNHFQDIGHDEINPLTAVLEVIDNGIHAELVQTLREKCKIGESLYINAVYITE